MKKIFNFDTKEGDKVIYIADYEVKESSVVKTPVGNDERPLFKVGRVDLANGDFLINGCYVYESIAEAAEKIIKRIDGDLVALDKQIKVSEGMKTFLNYQRKHLLNNIKDESIV